MAVALVMGQNIGTTITANLAATVANTAGKQAALAHLLFNVAGVLITLVLFTPMLHLITKVTHAVSGSSPHTSAEMIPLAISFFHTLFNVGNTLLLAFFIPQIIWLVNRMVVEGRPSRMALLIQKVKKGVYTMGNTCSRGLLWVYGMNRR